MTLGKKCGGVAQGRELYIERVGISLEAEKGEGTLHPLQKNKKVRAAKLAEEKHTEMLVAGVWEEGGHPNNCRRQELGKWHNPSPRE